LHWAGDGKGVLVQRTGKEREALKRMGLGRGWVDIHSAVKKIRSSRIATLLSIKAESVDIKKSQLYIYIYIYIGCY
jgi:hypothetical protein